MIRLLQAPLIALIFLCVFAAPQAQACMPYQGEILRFAVGWEFVTAGSASIRYSGMGKNGYRIDVDARSNAFFDMFRKVRDTTKSEGVCVDGKMQSTVFDVKQLESRYKANKSSRFLWQKNQVTFTQNNKTDIYDVEAGHLNVMDAFTRVRGLDLQPGDEIHIPVFDSRKTYDIIVKIGKKKKRLRAPWGQWVECLVVEPILKTEGVFSSKGRIKIWMTDDARHIPLKLIAKVKIGNIIGRLVDYQPPQQVMP